MAVEFNSLPWHDAALLDIDIDRSDPGNIDTVVIDVRSPDGGENRIIFSRCYFLDIKMNFGIIADEFVLQIEYATENEEIARIKRIRRCGCEKQSRAACRCWAADDHEKGTCSVRSAYAQRLPYRPKSVGWVERTRNPTSFHDAHVLMARGGGDPRFCIVTSSSRRHLRPRRRILRRGRSSRCQMHPGSAGGGRYMACPRDQRFPFPAGCRALAVRRLS